MVEPNKESFAKTVQDIEKSIIEIVGEELTYIRLAKRIDIVYNDDGKLEDLPFNRVIKDDILCGTFVIVAHHKDDWISLTNKQIRFYKKKFQVRFDKPLIEFLSKELKQSSNLLKCNLKGVEKLNKMIVSDRKMKKIKGE